MPLATQAASTFPAIERRGQDRTHRHRGSPREVAVPLLQAATSAFRDEIEVERLIDLFLCLWRGHHPSLAGALGAPLSQVPLQATPPWDHKMDARPKSER